MSTVPVHGPTMATPFAFLSEHIAVNSLEGLELEFKSLAYNVTSPDEYEWDFGDGTPPVIDGYEVRHTYAEPGTFVVTMSVETTEGLVTDQVEVTVGNGDGQQLQAPEEEISEEDEAA